MDLKRKETMKSSFFVLLAGLLLILAVFIASTPSTPFSSASIKSADDVCAFLADLGWETESADVQTENSTLPEQFDDVFTEYNSLQLQQGCDLSKYLGKEITVYTVPIKNYGDSSQNVYATIIIHKNKVIGGDIHSAEMNGFMHTLQ